MIRTALSIALALLALFVVPTPAQAGQRAYLVSCNTSSSVTGHFVYVGTYQFNGQYFTQVFTTYCPHSIEVY